MKEHLNLIKEKKKTKKRRNITAEQIRISDLFHVAYIAIFITKVEISTPGQCSIFKYNKHSNFYRTVILRLLNYDNSPLHVQSAKITTLL
jgi:hypothetical protein